MTRRNAKKSLILAALMGCSVLSPVEAQEQAPLHVQGERGSGMSIPRVLLPRPPTPPAGSKGDDLGNHIATMNLSMGGNTITNMLTNVDDMGSSVNMQTLLSYIGGIKGDNLGDHKATMALDLAMHKAINMADAYDGDDYDGVNLRTLKRYISEIPGDNLGSHIASQHLIMNGKNIAMGDFLGYDTTGGLPMVGPGLTIGKDVIWGLSLPKNPSEAANKEYVDSRVDAIDLSGVVYTTGDQHIDGVKSFVRTIVAQQGLDANNSRIVSVADPTSSQDAVNLRSLQAAVGDVERYKAGTGITFGTKDAAGLIPIGVNNTVVRTTGNQTLGGVKTFTSRIAANLGITANDQRIEMVADPTAAQDAVNLRTLQAAIIGVSGGDNLGNHIALQNINASNFKVINLADPTAAQDAVNLRTLQAAVAAGGDNLGNHIAIRNIDVSNFRVVNVAAPVNGGDVTNKTYVDNLFGSVAQYSASDGITFGAPVSGVTPIMVNSTVVRTTGNQTVGGVKTFSSRIAANLGITTNNQRIEMVADPTAAQDAVNLRTLQAAIVGVSGGDNLGNHIALQNINASNFKVINLADPTAAQDAVNLRTLQAAIAAVPDTNTTYTAGDGLTLAGTEFAVNTSVIRTTGNQTLGGVKTFSSRIAANLGITTNNQRIEMVADPTAAQDAVNLRTLQAAVAAVPDTNTTYTAGDGLSLAGTTFSVDASVVRTSGNQTINGVKTFTNPINMRTDSVKTINMQNAAGVSVATIDGAESDRSVRLNVYNTAGVATGGLMIRGTDGSIAPLGNSFFNANSRKVINVADPTDPLDAVNLRTLQAAVAGGDNLGNHIATQNINVSNFRVVNVAAPVNGGDVTNKTYVDNLFGSVAQYSASDGITFGAPVSGVTPIMVNSTVVRTTGNQTVGGVKTFSSRISANLGITTNNQRIEMVADPTAAQDAVNLRTLQAAVAAGGDNLGNHIATQNVNASNFKVINLADPTAAQDAVNLRTLQAAIAAVPDTNTTYTAGDGLTLAGTQFAVNGTVVRTTGNQTIGGVKTFTSPLVVTNTFNINGSAPSQQQNGLYVADLGTTVGTTLNPTLTAAVVAQINNTRSIGLTVDANGYLHGYRTHTNAGSYTWESQVRFADRLTTARTINGVAFDGSANITIPGDNLGNHIATRNLVMSGYDVTGVGTVSSTGTMWITAPTVRIGTEGSGAVGNYVLHVDDSQQTVGTRWAAQAPGISMSITGEKGWMVTGSNSAGFSVDGTWAAFGNVTRTGGTTNAWMESGQNTIVKSDGYVNVVYKTYFDISKQTVVRDSNNQTISIDNDPAFRVQPGAIKIGLPMSMSGADGASNYKITDLGDATNPLDAVNLRTLKNYHTGSSGITIGAAGAISVDATVVRTSGPQTIAGQKIFTTRVQGNGGFDAGGQTILRVATPVNGTDAANKAYVDSRTSDIRLKKNVEEMTGDQGLSIIRRLRPVTFDYKKDDKHFAGVIAQETREVMPYTVVEGEDGYLGVEYIQFIAPIISSVKALDNEVTSLKARVEGIETRLEALEAR